MKQSGNFKITIGNPVEIILKGLPDSFGDSLRVGVKTKDGAKYEIGNEKHIVSLGVLQVFDGLQGATWCGNKVLIASILGMPVNAGIGDKIKIVSGETADSVLTERGILKRQSEFLADVPEI